MMKIQISFFITIIFILGCESNHSYPWVINTTYDDLLKISGEKLILLDFETEW